MNEAMPRIALNRGEVLQIPGIRERVERHDLDVRSVREHVANERGTDETGAASHQKLHQLGVIRVLERTEGRRESPRSNVMPSR